MKSGLFLSFIFALTSGVAHAADSTFKLRASEWQDLPNGMKILWVPDNALPYVNLKLMVKSGSAQDPAGKEGLASFTASMLERGTNKHSALQISQGLEQLGSSFWASTDADYTMLNSESLSFNKDETFNWFTEIVMRPSFAHAEIEKLRKLTLGSLQRIGDDPGDFAGFLMARYLFGAHPYGHNSVGLPKAVRSLRKVDLQKYYNTAFTPENSVLSVVGQYDQEFRDKIVKTFSAWSKKPTAPKAIPEFPAWKGTQLLLVNRADLNQAQIQIGFKGVPRNASDYMELRAALKILGESFGSRLFEEIREKRGLTYSISAWFDPREVAGPMGITTFTRVDKVSETVGETLKTYRLFAKEGVTSNEVDNVKALMKGQFPRIFETAEAVAYQLLILHRYGVSEDYFTNYMKNLEAIDKTKINAAIKRYFDPENLKILVYAPKDKTQASLAPLGPVEVKEYKEFLQ